MKWFEPRQNFREWHDLMINVTGNLFSGKNSGERGALNYRSSSSSFSSSTIIAEIIYDTCKQYVASFACNSLSMLLPSHAWLWGRGDPVFSMASGSPNVSNLDEKSSGSKMMLSCATFQIWCWFHEHQNILSQGSLWLPEIAHSWKWSRLAVVRPLPSCDRSNDVSQTPAIRCHQTAPGVRDVRCFL